MESCEDGPVDADHAEGPPSPSSSSSTSHVDTTTEEGDTSEIATDGKCAEIPADAKLARRGGRSLVSVCWRLLCDIMLVIFIISTVLGVVTNTNQPKIRAAAKPRPFVRGANVKDYFRGDVFQAFADASQFENALLMFYAPWDRESQEARAVLLELAEFYAETDMLVAAVNCWYPTSDCAKEFGGKASGTRFPVFIFYPAYLKGVQYRGPARADLLISWVARCRYPVTPLLDAAHLRALRGRGHTNLLVAFTPGLATNRLDTNTAALLQCAYLLLESDSETRVAVTSDPELARSLHLHPHHPVKLFSWNATYSFPNKTVESSRCRAWTLRHSARPAAWLTLPGRKSLLLQSALGPHTLLVFSPRAVLGSGGAARVVTEVAARYRDCNQTQAAAELVTSLRQHEEPAPGPGDCDARARTRCQLRSFSVPSSDPVPACVPDTGARWTNLTRDGCEAAVADPGLSEVSSYGVDLDVALLLREEKVEKRLARLKYGGPAPELRDTAPPASYSAEQDPVAGLGCRDNRSLALVMVDTQSPGHGALLADSLGLRLGEAATSLALVSVQEERLALVRSSAAGDAASLRALLEQSLVTWHRADSVLATDLGQRSSERSVRVQVGRDTVAGCEGLGPGLSCVREVTRDTLAGAAGSSAVSVVLVYTSPYCSQCSVTSHTLHTVATLLHQAGIQDVVFRMLDSTRNDPPLQFTALAHPSLIFLPRGRAEHSRVFPAHKELTVASVLAFVLSNLSAQQRLRLALASCDTSCVAKLSLRAGQDLDKLEAARRRLSSVALGTGRGRVLARRIKHVRTVLYILSAIDEEQKSNPDLPRSQSQRQRYYSAILDSFINN